MKLKCDHQVVIAPPPVHCIMADNYSKCSEHLTGDRDIDIQNIQAQAKQLHSADSQNVLVKSGLQYNGRHRTFKDRPHQS